MARYAAEDSDSRGGWCVFKRTKNELMLEYHSGPFLRMETLDKVRELNSFWDKPNQGRVNSRHECLNCLGAGCSSCKPEKSPVKKREGLKFITALPDNEQCVGLVVFNDRVIVATTRGVFYLNEEGLLEPIQFIENAFDHMETCEHGKGMSDYCEPCGRVNGG